MKKQFMISLALAAGFSMNAYSAGPFSTSDGPGDDFGATRPASALQITPYLWASSLKGDISPFKRAPTIAIEKSFGDIVDDLNFGGFIDIWARRDRFVFSGDLIYVNTTDSRNIRALPVIGQTPGLSARADTKQFTASLKGGYRVYSTPVFTVDLLAGLRYWYVSNDVAIYHPAHSVEHGENFSWVDPLLGLRTFYHITPRLSVQGQADMGGLGAGSEQTWQVLATASYTFTEQLSVSAGYKALSVDYDSRSHVFDTTLQGPVLGVTYRF